MRKEGCQTVVVEEREWSENCSESVCGSRYQSCIDYINNLPSYNYNLLKKKCNILLFFASIVSREDEMENNSSFLGYCIVHNDVINEGNGKPYRASYVTESCIVSPLKWNAYILPPGDISININGKEYNIRTNYFSQQNGITNCCAHAAIKMAIRAYYPQVTAEIINKNIPVNHIQKRGNEGLTPDEICRAIEKLSKNETYISSSIDLASSSDFLRLVYLSLESRLPVILLFHLIEKGEVGGHAVTLIGHTFNEHSWSSYGLKGYFSGENISYLPSSIWCDNLVVHDDNWGPYYLVSTRFLTDSADFSYILRAVEKAVEKVMATSLPVPIRYNWPIDPVTAIIVYPKDMSFIKNGLLVEPWALASLNRYVSKIWSDDDIVKGDDFIHYFHDYQKEGNRNLILRTFCLSKNEYLKFIDDNLVLMEYRNMIKDYLPNTFWITEISIPELYWVNRKKVGEIITDPETFNQSMEVGVILIRLPGIISFIENDDAITINVQENQTYYDLITPTGLSQFKNI